MDFVIITLAALLAAPVFLFFKLKFDYWTKLGVPCFETKFLYGNTKGLSKQFHVSELTTRFYQKTKQIGERYCGLYFFIRPVLMVVNLDIVKAILIRDFNTFPNRGIYYNEKDDPVSAHLFNLENEQWKILRQKLSPTFTSGKLKMMFKTIDDVSVKLLNVIDKRVMEAVENNVDIRDILGRFTTDVIGSAAFGIECNSLEDEHSRFYEFGVRIFAEPSSIFVRFFRNTFKNLARTLRIRGIPEDISNFYMGITKETVEYREKNAHLRRQDFMNLLVQMKQDKLLTVEQIAAQSFIFFLAGYETSASTMTYCFYELSINQDIQERARENVRRVLMKHNNEFTYDAVNEMRYLEQCVDETLRKYPVVPVLQRCAMRDYKIPNSNVTIPRDQSIWIPVYAIHHDPAIYPNPEQFNPNRFSPEEVEKRHPCAYIPFGEGNRICIGARFGKMEVMLGMAKILINYKFTLDRSRTPVPLRMSPKIVVLTAADRIFLHMEKIV